MSLSKHEVSTPRFPMARRGLHTTRQRIRLRAAGNPHIRHIFPIASNKRYSRVTKQLAVGRSGDVAWVTSTAPNRLSLLIRLNAGSAPVRWQ